MTASSTDTLAINGGTPVRTEPFPHRRLFGEEEKQAAVALFDEAIRNGEAFGYNGEQEAGYASDFCAFQGGGHADVVNSGTSAVYVALRALDLEPFTEVITPAISDPGGVMPVALLNCIPIPADTAPGSYNVGPEQIAARITERTSAILVAHISGHACDLDGILALAAKHDLPVIEDCAQAHGATYKGRKVGTFGRIAAFSTMSGKHHATGAQGGVVYTPDESLYWQARRASDRGKPFNLADATGNVIASQNLNSNEMACAIGRAQIKKLPGIIAARQRIADALAQRCADQLQSVRLNTGLPDTRGVYWFALFHIDESKLRVNKQAFVEALAAEGIPAGGTYYHAPTEQPWAVQRKVFGSSGYPWTSPLYKGDPDAVYALPNAKAADAAHFRMGLHERCGDREVDDIIAALVKVEQAYLV